MVIPWLSLASNLMKLTSLVIQHAREQKLISGELAKATLDNLEENNGLIERAQQARLDANRINSDPDRLRDHDDFERKGD